MHIAGKGLLTVLAQGVLSVLATLFVLVFIVGLWATPKTQGQVASVIIGTSGSTVGAIEGAAPTFGQQRAKAKASFKSSDYVNDYPALKSTDSDALKKANKKITDLQKQIDKLSKP